MPTVNKAFSDLITFTRASTASYTGADGYIHEAGINEPRFDYDPVTREVKGILIEETRTNLITPSTVFTYPWSHGGTSPLGFHVIPNASDGPRGPMTMTALIRQGVGTRYAQRGYVGAAGKYAYSIYLKAGTGNYAAIRFQAQYPERVDATVNLTTGNVVSSASGGATVHSATATHVGGGVFRVVLIGTVVSTTNGIYVSPVDTATRQVDGAVTTATSCYVDCAQLEFAPFSSSFINSTSSFTSRGSVATKVNASGEVETVAAGVERTNAYLWDADGTLVPRGSLWEGGATNLLRATSLFDANAWLYALSSLSSTNGTGLLPVINSVRNKAPDGSLNAYDITLDCGGGTASTDRSGFYQSTAGVVGETYASSFFVKPISGATIAQLTASSYFGTILSGGSLIASRSIPIGDGWYYVQKVTSVGAAGGSFRFQLAGGDGFQTARFLLWGAQCENLTYPTSHMPSTEAFTARASVATYIDSSGVMQTAASGVARTAAYEYDTLGTLRPLGLLLEPARTNFLRNSVLASATVGVIGSGGVMPTGFTTEAFAGLTATIVATGTEAGMGYFDLNLTGTGTGSSYVIRSGSTTAPNTGVIGDRWTASVKVKLMTGGAGELIRTQAIEATGAYPGSFSSPVTPETGFYKRVSATHVVTLADSPMQWRLFVSTTNGVPINLTIRIACPQLELGGFATSFIATASGDTSGLSREGDSFTTTALTRSADSISSPTSTRASEVANVNDLNPWFRADAGTLVAYGSSIGSTNDGVGDRIVALSTDSSNYMSIQRNASASSGTLGAFMLEGGVAQLTGTTVTISNNQPFRYALSYSEDNSATSANGSTALVDGSTTIPTITKLAIGYRGENVTTTAWSGHIKSIRYYPDRLSNELLQILTLGD